MSPDCYSTDYTSHAGEATAPESSNIKSRSHGGNEKNSMEPEYKDILSESDADFSIGGISGAFPTPTSSLSMEGTYAAQSISSVPTLKDRDGQETYHSVGSDGQSERTTTNLSESKVPVESICPDGDLLLHIRCDMTPQDGTINEPDNGRIVLSMRVSSTMLRSASSPLKRLLDTSTINQSSLERTTPQNVRIFIHEPCIWGCREGKGTFSLTIKSRGFSEELKEAVLLVFSILHHKKVPHHGVPLPRVTFAAELAWVLNCVDPIVLSLEKWLRTGKSRNELLPVYSDIRMAAGVVLGFVLEDIMVFENASLQWLLYSTPTSIDNLEQWSFAILPLIHADLHQKRLNLTRSLSKLLSSSLAEYCQKKSSPLVVGALLCALSQASVADISPSCPNSSNYDPRLQLNLQWQINLNDQSIYSLIGKILDITKKFSDQIAIWDFEDVLPKFATNTSMEFKKLTGLKLDSYLTLTPTSMLKMSDLRSYIGIGDTVLRVDNPVLARDLWELDQIASENHKKVEPRFLREISTGFEDMIKGKKLGLEEFRDQVLNSLVLNNSIRKGPQEKPKQKQSMGKSGYCVLYTSLVFYIMLFISIVIVARQTQSDSD